MSQNIAIFCAGNDEYFSEQSSPPYVALSSFRDQFANEFDYFCCGDLNNNSLDQIKFHNFIPLMCKVKLDGLRDCAGKLAVETFLRLFIPQQLQDMGYEFAIYIDGDVYCNKRFQISDILPKDHDISMAHHPGTYKFNAGVILYNIKRYCEIINPNLLIKTVIEHHYNDQQVLQYLIDQKIMTCYMMPYWYNFCLRTMKMNTYKIELQKLKDQGKTDADIINKIFVAHFVRGKPWIDEINVKDQWNYEIRNYFSKRYLLKQSKIIECLT